MGYWENLDELSSLWQPEAEYRPQMKREAADALYGEWQRAVERSRGWVKRGSL
ncbi:MAG TPA: hypothetical protein GX735_04225 [Firmicutes bacterium]|nr:hypothetical protein [Bacillota bacterium]